MITHRLHPRLHRRQGQDAPDPRRDRRRARRSTGCRPSTSRSSASSSRASSRSKKRCAGRRTSTSSSSRSRASRPPPTWPRDRKRRPAATEPASDRASARQRRARRRSDHRRSADDARCRATPTSTALTCSAGASCPSAQLRERLLDREHAPRRHRRAPSPACSRTARWTTRGWRAPSRGPRSSIKGRGRLRVQRELQTMGIAKDVAREPLAEVFGDVDERALIATGAREAAARRHDDRRRPRVRAPLPVPDRARASSPAIVTPCCARGARAAAQARRQISAAVTLGDPAQRRSVQ